MIRKRAHFAARAYRRLPKTRGALVALLLLASFGCSGSSRESKIQEERVEPVERIDMSEQTETAIIAGGCFWGMEDLLRKIDGVVETEVGYCGGENRNATYKNHPGHAEAVRIVLDPAKITFEDLLVNWFFRMHDPTTLDRQGNDRGSSYRSTIFYFDDAQKQVAEAAIRKVDAAGRWPGPIVTTVEAVRHWSPGEGYHQDYLIKNPGGYTCHWLRDWERIPTGE